MAVLTQTEIAEKLRGEDLNHWLELWHAEQGPAKRSSLELMAAVVPASKEKDVRVLDICCGPGDAGRALGSRFPTASMDFVDRDPFFASLCAAVNQRDGFAGRTLVRDLSSPNWSQDLASSYDVVVAANGLHWFTIQEVTELFTEVIELLRSRGCFLFMEPTRPEFPFQSGFATWQHTQPGQHRHEDWIHFWSSVNAFLGYDHMPLDARPPEGRIGDTLSALDWVGLLKTAGFEAIDILLRDTEKVVVAGLKP